MKREKVIKRDLSMNKERDITIDRDMLTLMKYKGEREREKDIKMILSNNIERKLY